MEKRWVIREKGDEDVIKKLSEELDISEYLANLLAQRGIKTFEEARTFFRPDLSQLHDPFLMKDMDKAVSRILKAIREKENILVYGDYDVDGTTAVALVYSFLKKIGAKLDFYIPDRYAEGYGISKQGIDFAAENNFKLIIALDCGIKAIDKIEYAKAMNLEFIIGDHHRPGDQLPNAAAVLDPKREDCPYPYKELSGCGVGFKLVQAIAQSKQIPFKQLEEYLDLVAISIAADIVPITGENRVLAHFGLDRINRTPRKGVEAILKYTSVRKSRARNLNKVQSVFDKPLGISDLVFQLGPRINAAGRIESGKDSVRLLISKTTEESDVIADQINDLNTERRSLDSKTTEEALAIIESDPEQKNKKANIVFKPDWSKGVIGIVASRLIENYYKPTIVFTKSNGLLTASCRSVHGFDIYDAIESCSSYMEHFGGHTYAAGLSIKPENFDPFCQCFEKYVQENINETSLVPQIKIDVALNLNDLNQKFYRIIQQLAPFGPGNMLPVFQVNELIDTGKSRIVGEKHIKLDVVHKNTSGYPISGIAFQQADKFNLIKSGSDYYKKGNSEKQTVFNLCFTLEENEWNGVKNLQLNVKDIKAFNE
ncbi:MAG: single-stranded-DNA-specific exonuclease RecJ [Bacteroidales bacterium]|jgi:single-stranded-DNA-specific exonuclease|nr:single-stranded-DNA-specific exonuclease RecJ [Bacteroidales bacterium]